MFYTLGTASKATGKAKATIRKAILSGRISAQKNDIGEYQIDPAELHRVFPPLSSEPERQAPPVFSAGSAENTYKNIALETEIKGLRELLAQVKDERDRERANHDATKSTLESLKRLLPPPLPAGAMQETESAGKPKKNWFFRLFGG